MEQGDWHWFAAMVTVLCVWTLGGLASILRKNAADRAWTDAMRTHESSRKTGQRLEAAADAHDQVMARNAWAHMAGTAWRAIRRRTRAARHVPRTLGVTLWYQITGRTNPAECKGGKLRRSTERS